MYSSFTRMLNKEINVKYKIMKSHLSGFNKTVVSYEEPGQSNYVIFVWVCLQTDGCRELLYNVIESWITWVLQQYKGPNFSPSDNTLLFEINVQT